MLDEDWSDEPEAEEPECVVCGVTIKKGKRYCGPSCEWIDELGTALADEVEIEVIKRMKQLGYTEEIQ